MKKNILFLVLAVLLVSGLSVFYFTRTNKSGSARGANATTTTTIDNNASVERTASATSTLSKPRLAICGVEGMKVCITWSDPQNSHDIYLLENNAPLQEHLLLSSSERVESIDLDGKSFPVKIYSRSTNAENATAYSNVVSIKNKDGGLVVIEDVILRETAGEGGLVVIEDVILRQAQGGLVVIEDVILRQGNCTEACTTQYTPQGTTYHATQVSGSDEAVINSGTVSINNCIPFNTNITSYVIKFVKSSNTSEAFYYKYTPYNLPISYPLVIDFSLTNVTGLSFSSNNNYLIESIVPICNNP